MLYLFLMDMPTGSKTTKRVSLSKFTTIEYFNLNIKPIHVPLFKYVWFASRLRRYRRSVSASCNVDRNAKIIKWHFAGVGEKGLFLMLKKSQYPKKEKVSHLRIYSICVRFTEMLTSKEKDTYLTYRDSNREDLKKVFKASENR